MTVLIAIKHNGAWQPRTLLGFTAFVAKLQTSTAALFQGGYCLLGVARSASAFLGGGYLLTLHLFKTIFPRGKDTGLVNIFLWCVKFF